MSYVGDKPLAPISSHLVVGVNIRRRVLLRLSSITAELSVSHLPKKALFDRFPPRPSRALKSFTPPLNVFLFPLDNPFLSRRAKRHFRAANAHEQSRALFSIDKFPFFARTGPPPPVR